jgi:hypothetical protein
MNPLGGEALEQFNSRLHMLETSSMYLFVSNLDIGHIYQSR